MTPFTPPDYMKSDLFNNISEENIIGSGGSRKVYHVHILDLIVPLRITAAEYYLFTSTWRRVTSTTSCIVVTAGSPKPLDWATRLIITIDDVRGLNNINQECRHTIIHRDIKLGNILLDPQLHAKIDDFTLARMVVNPGLFHHMSAVCGTHMYMTTGENLRSNKAS
ncbi:hypothetical protein ZWY2020_017232 [Hordeum vulgare]|nr:hypothetical protein ZWY2020_017232 [Hordeum vulgare]